MNLPTPTTDSELETMVRDGITGYADSPDELPESQLDEVLKVAKLRLGNRTGSDAWYSDSGLGQALVFTTAILAKSQVENYSVSAWSIGNQTIDVSGASDDEAQQFQSWAQSVHDGLEASSSGSGRATLSNTAEYIG